MTTSDTTVQVLEQTTEPPAAAPPAREYGAAGSRAIPAFAGLFAVSLICACVGRRTGIEALALGGGYGVVFFGIGGAPFQLRSGIDLWARLTGAVLVGFSALLIAGGVMADISGLWDPVAAALILGGAAVAMHLVGVVRHLLRVSRARASEPGSHPPEFERPRSEPRPAWRGREHRPTRWSLLLTVIGSALWLGPAIWTRDPNPGYWGLLKTIGPLWYAGLVMVLIGFAVGRRDELSAAIATASFGLATTLTPALVYGAPEEQTAGKQMQLTQYVLVHHHVDVTAGIYRAYSATFSGVAALTQLLGIHGMLGHMSLLGLATYWPVLLVPMRVAGLRLLTGRALRTTSRRWCGVMLVVLVDSLGADYFSPQAIGYVMAVGMVAVAMDGTTERPFGKRATFWLLLLAGIALGPTHELSPYMAAGALIVLALFGQAPRWAFLPVALPALAWAGVVHRVVSKNFSFSALFNLSNFRPPVTVATPGLHRLAIVGAQSHLLLAALMALIVLGGIGMLANIRRRWAWAYALCPIVGISFIAINPYGNEGIFRATLFAIPWMAILAVNMPLHRLIRALRRRAAMTTAICIGLIALLGTFLVAAYSMDGTNVLPLGNVAVVDHLTSLPARNAFVLSVGSADNPASSAPSTQNYTALEWSQVTTGVGALQRLHPAAADLTTLANHYRLVAKQNGATPRSPLYIIWAHSSLLYDNAYGLQSPAEMSAWLRLLQHSRTWRLADQTGGTYLFRLT